MSLVEYEYKEQAEKRIFRLKVQKKIDILSRRIVCGAWMGRLLWAIVTLKSMEGKDLYGSLSALSFGLVIFPASCLAAYPEMS
jgi:hypothetical protein